MVYSKHFKSTPQSQPVPMREAEMTPNNAGGYAFKADDWTRLTRFLVIGAEGGSFYETEKKLTLKNAEVVLRCATEDYTRTVNEIVRVSEAALAPKVAPALFALALISGKADKDARQYALSMLERVARTASHLFEFIDYVTIFRGWGRSLRSAVNDWLLNKPADDLAYQLIKYRSRSGMTGGDLIVQSHPRTLESAKKFVLDWATGNITIDTDGRVFLNQRQSMVISKEYPRGFRKVSEESTRKPVEIILAFEEAKNASESRLVELILDHNLPREAVPNTMLNSVAVWDALLQKMPTNALIRNLNKMSAINLFDAPFSQSLNKALELLTDAQKVKKSRVHPLWIIKATKQYKAGHGDRGSLTWRPHARLLDALDQTFELSFHNVDPVNANIAVAVDTSGSMRHGSVSGVEGLSALEAAAAVAMVYQRVQSQSYTYWFDTKLNYSDITPRDPLATILTKIAQMQGGGTDCALVFNEIARNRVPVDGVLMVTDGESWAGNTHAFQEIRAMRQTIGRPTRWVTLQVSANETTLQDPKDALAMEMGGFSPDNLLVANLFFAGEI